MLDSHYLLPSALRHGVFARQLQVKWLTISYVNREIHSDTNISTPVTAKNIICNNPNRDCNNFSTTITKLFTYFHNFIKIDRLIYFFLNNKFTQITDYASVYKTRKLNVAIYRVFPRNAKSIYIYFYTFYLYYYL